MSLIPRKILVGSMFGEIPVHQTYETSTNELVDPSGARLAPVSTSINGNFLGTPSPDSKIFFYLFSSQVNLPQHLEKTLFWCEISPSSETVFKLSKIVETEEIQIGNVAFYPDRTTSISFLSEIAFQAGDLLVITAPSNLNGLTNITWCIEGIPVKILLTTPEVFFTVTGNTITGYDLTGGTDVVIPPIINGTAITGIADDAFVGATSPSTGFNTTGIQLLANDYEITAAETEKLTSVVVPEGVTEIGARAFKNNEIVSIQLPRTLNTVDDSAFENNLLSEINLPNFLTNIGSFAFANNKITNVKMPKFISLASHAFYGQQNNCLTSITIEEGIIGINAFADNKITNISIGAQIDIDNGDSVGINGDAFKTYYDSNGKLPGVYVFAGGSWTRNEKTITHNEIFMSQPIAGHVPETELFDNNTQFLGTISWEPNDPVYLENQTYTATITIDPKQGYTTLGLPKNFFNVFYGSTPIKSFNTAEEPDTVTVTFPKTSFFGFNPLERSITYYNSDGGNLVSIPSYINGVNVDAIAPWAFANKNITALNNLSTVSEIGDGAFTNNSIATISLSTRFKYIPSSAFQNNQLTMVNIPSGVEYIHSLAFDNNRISSLSLGSNLLIIGSGAFSRNNLTSITIPNGVQSIEDGAFAYNDITSVTIGNNVQIAQIQGTLGNYFNSTFANAYLGQAGTYVYNPGMDTWNLA